MVGADTAAAEDTVLVVVTVAAIAAMLVVPHAVVSVVTAASAVATAEAMAADIADNDREAFSGVDAWWCLDRRLGSNTLRRCRHCKAVGACLHSGESGQGS